MIPSTTIVYGTKEKGSEEYGSQNRRIREASVRAIPEAKIINEESS
jgi:hypothetical protein